MAPLIRITRADDADECLILDRDKAEFGGRGPHHDTVWWVLGEAENAYAGAYVDVDGVLRLERVWVREDLRGQGLQRRMLEVREAWGRRQGCAWARTYTHVDNVPSMRVLERAGYRVIKVTTYGGEKYLRFARPLRAGAGPVPEAVRA